MKHTDQDIYVGFWSERYGCICWASFGSPDAAISFYRDLVASYHEDAPIDGWPQINYPSDRDRSRGTE